MVVLHDYIMRRSLKRDSVLADADRVEHLRRYHVVKQQKTREQSREHGEEWGRYASEERRHRERINQGRVKQYKKGTGKVRQGHPRSTEIRVPKCT